MVLLKNNEQTAITDFKIGTTFSKLSVGGIFFWRGKSRMSADFVVLSLLAKIENEL